MNVDRLPDDPRPDADGPRPDADHPRPDAEPTRSTDSPAPENPAPPEPEHHPRPERAPGRERNTDQEQQPDKRQDPASEHPPESSPTETDSPAHTPDPAEPRSRQEHATPLPVNEQKTRAEAEVEDRGTRVAAEADAVPDSQGALDDSAVQEEAKQNLGGARSAEEPTPDDLPQEDTTTDDTAVSETFEPPNAWSPDQEDQLRERANQPNTPTQNHPSEGFDRGPGAAASTDDSNMRTTASADGETSRQDDGKPIDDRTHSLTDREWAEHITEVRDSLGKAYEQGLNTDSVYTIDGAGEVWLEEREQLHDTILEDLYSKAANVPCDFKALVAGGLGGAGKTTVLTQQAGVDLSRYLMINPDDIKQEMARRGMIPEIDNLSPMEASELAHEESSHLAKRLAHRAQADGKNLIWDITMSSEKSTSSRIEDLRKAGYTQVDGLFVDISVATSITRIESRHREGHDAWCTGKGLGGRYVPPEIVESQADPQWESKNRRTYEEMKERLDSWSIYDNSVDDRPAELIESSEGRRVH